jgi:hypothetical protein
MRVLAKGSSWPFGAALARGLAGAPLLAVASPAPVISLGGRTGRVERGLSACECGRKGGAPSHVPGAGPSWHTADDPPVRNAASGQIVKAMTAAPSKVRIACC